MMLERLRQLDREQKWAEVLDLVPFLPGDLTGDRLARAYIIAAFACEKMASSGREYRTALHFSRLAVASAQPGSFQHTWALHSVACHAADLGLFQEAERAARGYEAALPTQEKAGAVAPWVWFALGRALHYQQRYGEALVQFSRAISSGAAGDLLERVQVFRVWTLAEIGRPSEAFAALPSTVEHLPLEYVSAAMAAVCASAGDWVGARVNAKAALKMHTGGRAPVYDTVQAAELYLILKRAAQELGLPLEAAAWFMHSAATLHRWNAELSSALLPMLRTEGGVCYHAAASSCGPAGYHRTGLRGCVG